MNLPFLIKNPQPFSKSFWKSKRWKLKSISVPSHSQIWVFLSAFTIGHCAIALKEKKKKKGCHASKRLLTGQLKKEKRNNFAD